MTIGFYCQNFKLKKNMNWFLKEVENELKWHALQRRIPNIYREHIQIIIASTFKS